MWIILSSFKARIQSLFFWRNSGFMLLPFPYHMLFGRCILFSKDEAKGKAKQANGKMKEAEGKMQEEWGKMKKKL
jgi:hypothetical protein